MGGLPDLAASGGNGDGVLSAGDAIWNELKVWQKPLSPGTIEESLRC